jgi:phosphate starvation-inducible membrane PsiE
MIVFIESSVANLCKQIFTRLGHGMSVPAQAVNLLTHIASIILLIVGRVAVPSARCIAAAIQCRVKHKTSEQRCVHFLFFAFDAWI